MFVPLFHVEHSYNKDIVSDSAYNKLKHFVSLITRWNTATGLVASCVDIWQRHIDDSVQLLPYIEGKHVLDVGSGGGFPGMVLAILNPQREWHLVESNTRKAMFLQEVRRQLEVPCVVHHQRVETLEGSFDTITARAFAPLPSLMEILFAKLTPNGRGVLVKGKKLSQEITEANKKWRFTRALFQSRTHIDGRIVVIQDVKRCL
ncbi:MAG: 16S rRNA (guanine(527)-N(7))-methyltransferase RsmG [Holosporales bacterium]|jgi:16S rRNA (guanine527-N7)-methyltransferase|nr:16S rRNA (guanine(527)-N(7))-methyltransferase RsmG [Holosporales bacterium]